MPHVEIDTPGGKKTFAIEEGVTLLKSFEEKMLGSGSLKTQIEWTRETEMFDDDIIVCAYMKAGTHWVWEILHMLTRNTTNITNATKETAMLEFRTKKEIAGLDKPRILNTHFPPSILPQSIKDKKCKIVFVMRNPKDITVSAYHHLKKEATLLGDNIPPLEEFKKIFLSDSAPYCNYFKYIKQFLQYFSDNPDIPSCILFYEDLKKDPGSQIRKLSKFLNKSYTDEFIEQVAKACGFENMKKAEGTIKAAYHDHLHQGDSSKEPARFMYRKGEVGDWKNYFTVAESEMYDAVIDREMKDTSVCFQYE